MFHAEQIVQHTASAKLAAGTVNTGPNIGNHRSASGDEVSNEFFLVGANHFVLREDKYLGLSGIKLSSLDLTVGCVTELHPTGPDVAVPGPVTSAIDNMKLRLRSAGTRSSVIFPPPEDPVGPVSYTHLTLPTILLV